ncbi:hypothetical protein [Campylobacter sp. RM9331]|uniref:hypothetical protein n=1 Tax=Campylobacter sp. RM9331 TaxID=2735729 RepID=UPI003FA4AC56
MIELGLQFRAPCINHLRIQEVSNHVVIELGLQFRAPCINHLRIQEVSNHVVIELGLQFLGMFAPLVL